MSESPERAPKSKHKNSKIRTTADSTYGRRHWEIVETVGTEEDLEKQRELEDKLAKAETLKSLETRKEDLKLENKIGKTSLINRETAKEQQGGFYCQTCDCLMKDSQAYLDHINGKKHNKLLGMSMRVERVGVERVKEKLQKLKKVGADKPIENFDDFEKKFEEEMKKKTEERHKMETGKKKLKVENEKIEAQLTANDVADFDLPLSFGNGKKKH